MVSPRKIRMSHSLDFRPISAKSDVPIIENLSFGIFYKRHHQALRRHCTEWSIDDEASEDF